MARLITAGYDRYSLHSITHGVMSDSALDEFRDRGRRGSLSNPTAQRYREQAYQELSRVDLSLVRDRVRSTRKRYDQRLDMNSIQALRDPFEHQQASSFNRRLLMLNPRARKLYNDGLIVGYHGGFEDQSGGRSGRDSEEYRAYYTGRYEESDNEEDCGFRTFLEDDLIPNSFDAPSQNEKIILRDNHNQQNSYFDDGDIDPTNQLGGTI